jgi:L-asparaginase
MAKLDPRPGGFAAMGGYGGVVGQVSYVGRFTLMQPPIQKHTFRSDVNVTWLPSAVQAVRRVTGGLDRVLVAVKNADG